MEKVDVPGFEFVEPLGRGAGSVIFKAIASASGNFVAVKYILPDSKDCQKYLRHIENEYRNLKTIHESVRGQAASESLIRPLDLVRMGRLTKRKTCAMVMEYVDGMDLRREHRYPTGQLVDFLANLAGVLELIHGCGFVHADLKPENIMIGPGGELTLIDFGFSCHVGNRAKTIRGTREYMAPEQVDRGVITERTDLYNLGATFYYLFSGRQVPSLIPSGSRSQFVLVSRDLRAQPLWELNPNLPPGVAQLIMACIDLDPGQRPASAKKVRQVLKPLAEGFYQERESAY